MWVVMCLCVTSCSCGYWESQVRSAPMKSRASNERATISGKLRACREQDHLAPRSTIPCSSSRTSPPSAPDAYCAATSRSCAGERWCNLSGQSKHIISRYVKSERGRARASVMGPQKRPHT